MIGQSHPLRRAFAIAHARLFVCPAGGDPLGAGAGDSALQLRRFELRYGLGQRLLRACGGAVHRSVDDASATGHLLRTCLTATRLAAPAASTAAEATGAAL